MPTSAVSSSDHVIEILDRCGLSARFIKIAPSQIGHLKLPTIIRDKHNAWWVFIAISKTGFQLEGLGGAITLHPSVFQERFDGWVVELSPDHGSADGVLKAGLALLLGNRRFVIQVVFATVVIQILSLSFPQFTRLAVDRVFTSRDVPLLNILGIGMICVAIFQAWFGWIRQRTILHIEAVLDFSIGRTFVKHILSLPFPKLRKLKLGELLQAQSGFEAARGQVTNRLLGTVLDGLLGLLLLVVMSMQFPLPTLVIGVLSLFLAAFVVWVGRRQVEYQTTEIQFQAEQRRCLVEMLSGIETIKTTAAEGQSLKKWKALLRKEIATSQRRKGLNIWNDIGLDGIRQAIMVSMLIWGGRTVLAGGAPPGAFVAFVQMSSVYLGTSVSLAQAYLTLKSLQIQLASADSLLKEKTDPPSPRIPPTPSTTAVSLQNVWFRYSEDQPWILKGISLEVRPGEKHWITGPSGFGKSTLLRIIAGLYHPQIGTVSIGGFSPSEARSHIAYLPQSVEILNGSLLSNLRFLSGGEPTFDRIRQAAQATGLDRLIDTLPLGYNTVLSHGGTNLSGGQRQLIALTAILASDRRIVLLDEAMANIDWLSRSWIQKCPWFNDRTVIFVSHDGGFS